MRGRGQDSCGGARAWARWRCRAHAPGCLALACSVVLMAVGWGFAPARGSAAAVKAMWGPATRGGVSLLPIYRELGVTIYEDDLRWNEIAPHRAHHPRNPHDPAYIWPGEVTRAV